MIALCQEHARKADGGAFTDDQLRELKREGRSRAQQVKGKFDWMRRDLLAVVGGNFYVETMTLVQFGSRPVVWFKRDEEGYLLLNFTMPTLAGQARARIEDNVWTVTPQVAEVICPPTGRKVEIDYGGGDYFRIEFFNVGKPESLDERYPHANTMSWSDRLPILPLELN
jgi:hypothetical protein